MSLRKAVSLGSIQTAVSIAVGFFSVKITSVYLGPAGVGVLGQLQLFMALALGIVVTGLNKSVVRRIAELADDTAQRAVVISTVLKMVLLGGLPVACLVLMMSGWLARELLHSPELRFALVLFAGTYMFGLVGTLILGCANGAKDFRATTLINISAAVVSLIAFAVLCPPFGLHGALVAVALMPAVSMGIGALHARRANWWPKRAWRHPFSPHEATRAMALVPAAAIGAVATPLIQIVLRDDLALRSGVASIGLLQGVTRLSDLYLGVVVSVFSMYFLPRFAQIKAPEELRRALLRALALIVPCVALVSVLLYLLRDTIISVVFTHEFAAMRDLFAWQMVGNVLKMTAWLFGLVMLTKGNALVFALYEGVSLLVWWRLGTWLIGVNGAVGATQAYAMTYAIYIPFGVVATAFVLRRMR